MHGKASWRVVGPSDEPALMSQLLRREVVEYIRQRREGRNRGVCFSFWYRPDRDIPNDLDDRLLVIGDRGECGLI